MGPPNRALTSIVDRTDPTIPAAHRISPCDDKVENLFLHRDEAVLFEAANLLLLPFAIQHLHVFPSGSFQGSSGRLHQPILDRYHRTVADL